jgi:glyoxylase-like metal-dependent hydrolase (beta-lactamase superfamily II)
LLWLKLELPFALNHVNIFLVEDDDGWALIDTGIANSATRAIWEGLLARGLEGRRISRLIVTHYHPDHAGLAGWLCERLDVPLSMPRTEYLTSQNMRHNPAAIDSPAHRAFYYANGLDRAAAEAVTVPGHGYLRMTTDLSPSYHRLVAGAFLNIGGRTFEILTGGGHSPEQAMLLCRAENLFLPADQVLARISPNISVTSWEPLADPLGDYLASLAALRESVPDDALVVPAHNLPFEGLHTRIDELTRHHDLRCEEIVAACTRAPRSAAEILPILFPRALDAHQTGFAFGEVLAHLNHLARAGALLAVTDNAGLRRFGAA